MQTNCFLQGAVILTQTQAGIVVGAGHEQAGGGLASRENDHADIVLTQLAQQTGIELDISAEEDPRQRGQWNGADALILIIKSQGTAIDANFNSLSIYIQVAHAVGFPSDNKATHRSTRLNSSHVAISYAVFCLKKKKKSICTYY